MLDKTIPYKNIIMEANQKQALANFFPEGYRIKGFEPGDEKHWAEIVTAVGEFETEKEAYDYFISHYSSQMKLLAERCLFILNEEEQYAGTCMAWFDNKDENRVGSLHWLAVHPDFQRKGLAKVLIEKVMTIFEKENLFPVYLHTQTWSYKAVLLYSRFGFHMLKTQTFSHYKNEYQDAIPILEDVLSVNDLEMLKRMAR
ncbi:GNAT family N-acetyltransferase [Scatolibacter rhodanostii]|uniref:GNAT family N-acetyltransferase n=1 Tax=Scatolibacter rhodanostii TaxID=2014781 RepID=UPI000C086210|nr:GNAT family N-acetyltransferase [Scatolibacter rhodanostii]